MKRRQRTNFAKELLRIEKHEDEMITAMVKLVENGENLNKQLNRITWVMLVLTWLTLIISIPNTLATFFGIPRISELLNAEVIFATFILSLIVPIILLLRIGFDFQKSKRHEP